VKRSLVLVGLSGSGKTTVGCLVADLLGAPFIDIDQEIERETGRLIDEFFAGEGEAKFRDHERAAVGAALAGEPAIVAPGGGWAAQPGALESAAPALVVYLACTPSVAAQRLANVNDRPLLAGPDRLQRLRELLATREPRYLAADTVVNTDGRTPSEVAGILVQLARKDGGW
jgi:shikimate kinase